MFRPLGGANLLVIGQNEEAARGLFAAACIGLAAQLSPHTPADVDAGGVDQHTPVPALRSSAFTILDGTPDDADDADYLREVCREVARRDRACRGPLCRPRWRNSSRRWTAGRRAQSADRAPRFLFVFGVHRFRDLRKSEEDFGFGRRGAEREASPAERFIALLRDGPPVGIHVIVWCDSLTNLNRAFDRPQLREFGLRVLFQMSATDSSTLMDSPAASKLGRNRALYLTEETERPEKFRPYGLPSPEWLARAIERLRARHGKGQAAVGAARD